MIWAEEKGKNDLTKQLANNLRDFSWRNGLGFQQHANGRDWARTMLQKQSRNMDAMNKNTDGMTVVLILQLLEYKS